MINCKDCGYCRAEYVTRIAGIEVNKNRYYCTKHNIVMDPDDYCSRAERKKE